MTKKNVFRFALIGLLTAVFLFFFLRSIKDWRKVLEYVANVDWRWFIPALLATPIHFFTRGLRWKYLLHHEKRDVRFSSLWKGNVVGFTVTFIGGRLGELVKPLYVAKREGMRPGFVIGTAVVERVFDIMTMTILLGLFLLGRPLFGSRMPVTERGLSKLYLFGGLAVAVAVLLLAMILWFYIYKDKALALSAKVLRILPLKLRDKMMELLRELIDGLRIFHNMADFLAYVGLGFLVWLSIIFYYWLYFFAFRFPVPFIWVFPYLFLTAVGASIPTPGMAGGYHIMSQLALVELLGMDSNMAGGYTIVVHLIQLVLTCLLGYAILWKEGLSLFQLKKLGEAIEK
ncbi:MAG: lysylphosphatidylglycerol synthase transmembrane domain-containing protein [Candidatus Aminicenantes bacterium]|nr:lysylphosphatidylglycerol synthase transmembrane domain-containing protein [Candidatus Aminicenantes bacterium]